MVTRVRRSMAAGLMVLALALGIVATGGTAAAQQPGTITTYPGPKNNSGVAAYGVSGNYTAPVLVPASDFAGFNGFYGYGQFGAPYYGVPFGYGGYTYGGSSPFAVGYGNSPYAFGYPYAGGGCTPQVSYTPAFGYGYGCQQFGTSPFSYPVGYYR